MAVLGYFGRVEKLKLLSMKEQRLALEGFFITWKFETFGEKVGTVFLNHSWKNCYGVKIQQLKFLTWTYLQPHYSNGVFSNVYLAAGTLRGNYCENPIAVMGVVDTFGHNLVEPSLYVSRFLRFTYLWRWKAKIQDKLNRLALSSHQRW